MATTKAKPAKTLAQLASEARTAEERIFAIADDNHLLGDEADDIVKAVETLRRVRRELEARLGNG